MPTLEDDLARFAASVRVLWQTIVREARRDWLRLSALFSRRKAP